MIFREDCEFSFFWYWQSFSQVEYNSNFLKWHQYEREFVLQLQGPICRLDFAEGSEVLSVGLCHYQHWIWKESTKKALISHKNIDLIFIYECLGFLPVEHFESLNHIGLSIFFHLQEKVKMIFKIKLYCWIENLCSEKSVTREAAIRSKNVWSERGPVNDCCNSAGLKMYPICRINFA